MKYDEYDGVVFYTLDPEKRLYGLKYLDDQWYRLYDSKNPTDYADWEYEEIDRCFKERRWFIYVDVKKIINDILNSDK